MSCLLIVLWPHMNNTLSLIFVHLKSPYCHIISELTSFICIQQHIENKQINTKSIMSYTKSIQ